MILIWHADLLYIHNVISLKKSIYVLSVPSRVCVYVPVCVYFICIILDIIHPREMKILLKWILLVQKVCHLFNIFTLEVS